MVNLVDDWGAFEEYATNRRGFYQVTVNDGITEIRVKSGECAFVREFKNREDSLLTRIMDLCRRQRFVKVSGSIPDDGFF